MEGPPASRAQGLARATLRGSDSAPVCSSGVGPVPGPEPGWVFDEHAKQSKSTSILDEPPP